MRIDVFSDMVCPFCYLGSRHLELALEQFDGAPEVEIHWRSYQLDPNAPATSDQTAAEMVAEKYGISPEQATASQESLTQAAAAVGLDYQLAGTLVGNTFDAHRLSHLADDLGGPALAGQWVRRVMRAHFTENRPIGDHEVLTDLAAEVGLDPQRSAAVLAGDEYADAVRADAEQASSLGIQGVPFFVFDNRIGVSGAQPPEVLLQALQQASAGE